MGDHKEAFKHTLLAAKAAKNVLENTSAGEKQGWIKKTAKWDYKLGSILEARKNYVDAAMTYGFAARRLVEHKEHVTSGLLLGVYEFTNGKRFGEWAYDSAKTAVELAERQQKRPQTPDKADRVVGHVYYNLMSSGEIALLMADAVPEQEKEGWRVKAFDDLLDSGVKSRNANPEHAFVVLNRNFVCF